MKVKLLRKSILDYPSASAVEFHEGLLYVIGDDAPYLLCLDPEWNLLKTIPLLADKRQRIPKPEKPDLESAVVIDDVLYTLGSGSLSPQRDVAFIVRLSDDSVKRINTAAFYGIFRDRGLVSAMNIEGFTACKDKLLLFNRGDTVHPNQLIITDRKILKKQFPDRFKVMPLIAGQINGIPMGISGAAYDEANDLLLLTASSEDTDNAYDDGAIAGSALCIVYNVSAKLDQPELQTDAYILLEKENEAFRGQKIESVCVTAMADKRYTCVLAADNDDGHSTLFEIELVL